MSHTSREFDTNTPTRNGQLSANAHWLFGSFYAVLTLVGFAFGVWAGAAKPKPTEVADAKQKEKDNTDKPSEKQKPTATPPVVSPEPKAKDVEPKAKEPEPKVKEPEPKPKEPDPKARDPEPKSVDARVVFKEVEPIFRAYCIECHGAPGKRPGGGVDLRTLVAIKKGDKNGDAILVPGNPEKSAIYESITSGRMPDGGKTPPPPDKLLLLKNWIQSGAKERRRPIRNRRDERTNPHHRLELTRKADAG